MGSRKFGVSTSAIEKSPARKKREAARRATEEKAWAARSGPVTVKRIPPET